MQILTITDFMYLVIMGIKFSSNKMGEGVQVAEITKSKTVMTVQPGISTSEHFLPSNATQPGNSTAQRSRMLLIKGYVVQRMHLEDTSEA